MENRQAVKNKGDDAKQQSSNNYDEQQDILPKFERLNAQILDSHVNLPKERSVEDEKRMDMERIENSSIEM